MPRLSNNASLPLPLYHVAGRPGANDRPALPPGHPVSWGLITHGTVLDGAEYPYPVFDVC